jgi:hypothetical protein
VDQARFKAVDSLVQAAGNCTFLPAKPPLKNARRKSAGFRSIVSRSSRSSV